eukprot:COSAG04_NODE_762_length_10515_cov_9.807508_4_plen_178_part_00
MDEFYFQCYDRPIREFGAGSRMGGPPIAFPTPNSLTRLSWRKLAFYAPLPHFENPCLLRASPSAQKPSAQPGAKTAVSRLRWFRRRAGACHVLAGWHEKALCTRRWLLSAASARNASHGFQFGSTASNLDSPALQPNEGRRVDGDAGDADGAATGASWQVWRLPHQHRHHGPNPRTA